MRYSIRITLFLGKLFLKTLIMCRPVSFFVLFLFTWLLVLSEGLIAAVIHSAPVVIPGFKVRQGILYPVSMYRLYKTEADGTPVPIPFQIDEINKDGDYVMGVGSPELRQSNGIFDLVDELVFMGDDAGPAVRPKWKGMTPSHVIEIKLSELEKRTSDSSKDLTTSKKERRTGAVYLAIFFKNPPPLSKKRYVSYDKDNATVVTSRYRYQFNQQNYLVVRGIEMIPNGTSTLDTSGTSDQKKEPTSDQKIKSKLIADQNFIPLVDSSTFYLKADLKYFITLEVNHSALNTALEGYKVGPVRVIVRVSFIYSFLKLNFELGMYTEVSFFSNAVFLPAILYNPLNGEKSLNRGSGFYYGFSMVDDPGLLDVETNMPTYAAPQFFDVLKGKQKTEPTYWISAVSKDRMMYVEIIPSKEMRVAGSIPSIFIEKVKGNSLRSRAQDKALPLGQSPVNMALFLDLTKLTEGEHLTTFRLFFENVYDPVKLNDFKSLDRWRIEATRM